VSTTRRKICNVRLCMKRSSESTTRSDKFGAAGPRCWCHIEHADEDVIMDNGDKSSSRKRILKEDNKDKDNGDDKNPKQKRPFIKNEPRMAVTRGGLVVGANFTTSHAGLKGGTLLNTSRGINPQNLCVSVGRDLKSGGMHGLAGQAQAPCVSRGTSSEAACKDPRDHETSVFIKNTPRRPVPTPTPATAAAAAPPPPTAPPAASPVVYNMPHSVSITSALMQEKLKKATNVSGGVSPSRGSGVRTCASVPLSKGGGVTTAPPPPPQPPRRKFRSFCNVALCNNLSTGTTTIADAFGTSGPRCAHHSAEKGAVESRGKKNVETITTTMSLHNAHTTSMSTSGTFPGGHQKTPPCGSMNGNDISHRLISQSTTKTTTTNPQVDSGKSMDSSLKHGDAISMISSPVLAPSHVRAASPPVSCNGGQHFTTHAPACNGVTIHNFFTNPCSSPNMVGLTSSMQKKGVSGPIGVAPTLGAGPGVVSGPPKHRSLEVGAGVIIYSAMSMTQGLPSGVSPYHVT